MQGSTQIKLSVQDQAKVWLDTLCSVSFAGRKVGTKGNYLAFQYLLSETTKMGFHPTEQVFIHDGGIKLRNIIVELEGEKTDSLFIIGAHYDGQYESHGSVVYQAANDNASGVVTSLIILDSLSRAPKPPFTTLVCFWDGEEGIVPPAFKGSSFFVKTFEQKESIVLYVNIDAMGHDHDNRIILGWYDRDESHRVKKMVDTIQKESLFDYTKKYRGQGEGSSDYKSFSQADIPYISYTDITLYCDHPQHHTLDTKEYVDTHRLQKVGYLTIDILNRF